MSSPLMQKHAPSRGTFRGHSTTLPRILLPAFASVALVACSESTAGELATTTIYGEAVRVGNGTARTYAVQSAGVPTEVGVALSEGAFTGLPADHAPGGIAMPDGHHTYPVDLPMPAGYGTPFRFVGMDWHPAGHEPPGIYDRPHFDFHFYTISPAERDAIVPSDAQFEAKGSRYPAAEFRPAGYTPLPGAVPLMGAHWVDPASPELNGKPFTATFLYGTWDGKLNFAEPMVTKSFLESKPDFRSPIATPVRYAEPGRYPTEYRVYWHAASREYRVALTGLVERR